MYTSRYLISYFTLDLDILCFVYLDAVDVLWIFYGIFRGELFFKTCPVKINVYITIVQFPLHVFVFS